MGEWNNRLSVVQYEEIVREDERQAHPREVSSCFSWFSLGSQTYYSCTSHLEMVPCDMKSKMQFHVLIMSKESWCLLVSRLHAQALTLGALVAAAGVEYWERSVQQQKQEQHNTAPHWQTAAPANQPL